MEKVATPVGSPTHYRLLKVLEHLEVDVSRVELVPMNSGSAANRALESGEVVMACHYGTQLRHLEKHGTPLMTGAEQEAIGLKMFDVISVATDFLEQRPEIVQAFIDVTNASNEQWKLNPDPMRAAIARAAHMDPAAANQTMAGFQFPSASEQKSEAWLGQWMQQYTADMASFFVEHDQIDTALESYDSYFSNRFVR